MINIIIIEDEAIIAENLKFTLEDLGFNVVSISYNFEDAAIQLNELSYDLALLDINLNGSPEKNGIELSKLVQKKNKPFIYLTAYNDVETINLAAKSKPSAYLIKPINPTMLFAAIQITLDHDDNTKTDQPDYFFSKIGNKINKVWWHEVGVMESIKNYVIIKTIDSKKEYLIRSSLAFVMQNMLPKKYQSDFIKINRALLIHNSQILDIDLAGYVNTTFGKFDCNKNIVANLHKQL